MLIQCSLSPPLQHSDSTAIFIPNLKPRSKNNCPISCNFSIFQSNGTSLCYLSRKPTKRNFRVPKFSLQDIIDLPNLYLYSRCNHMISTTYNPPFIISLPISRTRKAKSWKFIKPLFSAASCDQSAVDDESLLPPPPKNEALSVNGSGNFSNKLPRKGRVFFLDVNPLCYEGSTPSLHSFTHWMSLFFSQVSHNDPVIAVLDGERGNEYRRQLLPSYKANRRKIMRRRSVEKSHKLVMDVLRKCNVPVVKIHEHEADDVVATLVEQVQLKGYRAVIASPDKDFKQLISEDVQIVIPLPELNRWSFYTIKHYIAQYNCDPQSYLLWRLMWMHLGDAVDGVPGIQHLAPGFGRKTALKLLKKHGYLENILSAASVRYVGRECVQEALTKYADFLRRNYQVLALKRDVDIQIEEQWLSRRDERNDSVILSSFMDLLNKNRDPKLQNRSHSNGLKAVT